MGGVPDLSVAWWSVMYVSYVQCEGARRVVVVEGIGRCRSRDADGCCYMTPLPSIWLLLGCCLFLFVFFVRRKGWMRIVSSERGFKKERTLRDHRSQQGRTDDDVRQPLMTQT